MVRHFVTLCHSVSFEIIVKLRTQMSPGIRRELSMPCFQFLNIWHFHFFFFAFIFFNFYLLKKKTARAVKRHVGLILTRSGFEFCLMNSFYRSPILLCYSAIQVSVSCWVRGYFVKGLWCGIGAEWDIKLINWVNKSQFTTKNVSQVDIRVLPLPPSGQARANPIYSVRMGNIVGKARLSKRNLHINDNHFTKKAAKKSCEDKMTQCL